MLPLLALPLLASDPSPPAEAPHDRMVSFLIGGGAAGLIGGNGAGYGAGFAQRVGVDAALSHISSLQLDLSHSRHSLHDSSAYFLDLDAPADALTGSRDYLTLDLGLRLSLDFSGGAPRDPAKVHALPYIRFGLGSSFTDTKLDVPSFAGRQAIESKAVAPLMSLDAGCELQLKPFLSLIPHARMQGLVARDDGELDRQTTVGIEMDAQAFLDLALNY